MIPLCQWHDCVKEAEAEITVEGGGRTTPRTWNFCYNHYLEAQVVAEMMRRLTGIPEIHIDPNNPPLPELPPLQHSSENF